MPVQKHDLWLGAALTQVVEHPSFKALNKVEKPPEGPKQGHYSLNDDRRVLMKYSSSETSPWQFLFKADDLDVLIKDSGSRDKWFVALACGDSKVALLKSDDVARAIDMTSREDQSVSVEHKPNKWLEVCRGGKEVLKVADSAFPRELFA